ncbi:MAG: hypothetical protein E6G68_06160 [Actinobacteria bacterium]|nr:MAG: hypothetical protein E6G68_06160 [Actinomycetota bacterium]
MIWIEGCVATRGRRGGSKRKSAPWYGTPRASATLASNARSVASTIGSSEMSRTTSGENATSARSSASRFVAPSTITGTASSAIGPESFSPPPRKAAATI